MDTAKSQINAKENALALLDAEISDLQKKVVKIERAISKMEKVVSMSERQQETAQHAEAERGTVDQLAVGDVKR